ncbi:MAG: hypothetical protein WDA74_12335 [Spirochaetota bacterium]
MKKIAAFFIFVFISVNVSFASELQLEVIGAATASNLYLGYLAIGIIADSQTKEVYDGEKTVVFIDSISAQMNVQREYLQKFLASKEVPEADLAIVKKMVECFSLLVEEGNYLADYVKTGNKNSLSSYDGKRKQAWALISDILGLD